MVVREELVEEERLVPEDKRNTEDPEGRWQVITSINHFCTLSKVAEQLMFLKFHSLPLGKGLPGKIYQNCRLITIFTLKPSKIKPDNITKEGKYL